MTIPISKTHQWNIPVIRRYDAKITEVPYGLHARDTTRECFDDRSIGVAHDMGSIWIYVFEPETGALVANAVFGADNAVVRCDTIEVMLAYRGKGVAKALYQLASCIFEAPVVPSTILSPDAVKFWGKKTQIVYP